LKTLAYYFVRGIGAYAPCMYPEQFKKFGVSQEQTDSAYKFDIQALAGLLLVVLIPVGFFTHETVFFGAMWWLVTILVYSNWITLTVPLAERYMYLPNVGLMVFVITVLSFVHPLLWVAVFIWYATRMFTFMPMFTNLRTFLCHHTYWYPENDQCWVFRANGCAVDGDVVGVLYLSNEGLLNDMQSPLLWLHRASGFLKIGKKDMCAQALQMARGCAEGVMKNKIEIKALEIEKQLK